MSYASNVANREMAVYENLKKGNPIRLDLNQERDIEILSILEKLGYPMSHLGTYLYKDLISLVCEEIEKLEPCKFLNERKTIIEVLNNGYSSPYIWVATDDKDLGCKTFHGLVQGAIEEIDYDRTDQNLASKIYGSKKEVTYGTGALYIAEYYLNKNTYSNTRHYGLPKIKKLKNVDIDNKHQLLRKS